MKSKAKNRKDLRARRHARIQRKVRGTAERPRLVVYRSLRHVEAQLVDDDRGVTLLGVSTRAPAVQSAKGGDKGEKSDKGEKGGKGGKGEKSEARTGKVAASFTAGRLLAERAREVGVEQVVFDRGGFRYHGRVKALADGARDGGLRF